jgi:DNA invertase Pin-like site-specific DNA recombinase
MTLSLTGSQLRPDHLQRDAWIYVRQSTLTQVRTHTASTARQYALVQRAQALGWSREHIHVVDQDQGHSGASTVGRDGFQALVAEVGLGHAGAVLSLDVSRLARSSSDWYRLLEICALADTLVIDEEGIYDPGQYNDRLLLGFKGTMSEAELHWLHTRLLGGKLEKARHGQLRMRVPAGLIYAPSGAIVLDPDEEVQAAIRLVFSVFEQRGSALAVVHHFAQHGLRCPTRSWGGARDGELCWEPLHHGRVVAMLHNPAYAGAYVYGRTRTRTNLLPGEAPRLKGRTRQVRCEDWPIVLQDAHPGYLTWEQFRRNQHRLDDNRTVRPDDRRGVAREGAALLQGIVLCGRCGRRMSVRYIQDGRTPCYVCGQAHKERAEPTCATLRGDDIDAAVVRTFLEAMQPAQLEISLAALEEIEAHARQIDRQWQLRLERARYEATLTERRFLRVDPDNRLVARSLERDWNARLAEVEQLEREYLALPPSALQQVSAEERQRILALARDLPAVWAAPTTSQAERKQLLRFLIKDVALTRRPGVVVLGIRWHTEAVTTLEVPLRRKSSDVRRTDPEIVRRIRHWAADHTDQQIAGLLNDEQRTSGLGGTFTPSKVQWIRFRYAIDTGCPESPAACPTGQRRDGRYSAQAAAALLNVHVSTIAAWCQTGILDAVRAQPHGPRWIMLTPQRIAALRKPSKRAWTRRPRS